MKRFFSSIVHSARDEVRTIFSFRPLLVILLALPLVYPLAVALLYSKNTAEERPAVIVDGDNSAVSRTFTLWIDATRDIKIVDRLSTVQEGWDRIRQHRAEMLIFIPPDFSTHVKKGQQATYKVWVNSANIYTLGTSLPGLYSAAGTLSAGITAAYLMKRGISPSVVAARAVPIVTDTHHLFLPFGGYGEFFAPGILMTVIQQMMLICLGFSVGYQKSRGILRTDEPFLFSRIVAKLLVQSPFYVSAVAFVVYVIMPLFGWSATSLDMCMVLFCAMLIALAPLAILLSAMLKDHIAALEFLMFLSAPLFLMSGFTWPYDQMPAYIRTIASAFPLTPALQALRVVLSKSSDLKDLLPYVEWMGKLFFVYTLLCVVLLFVISQRGTLKRMLTLKKSTKGAEPLDGLA